MPVTDVDKNVEALTMTITAEFDADAARLWELWSDPRQGMTVTIAEGDGTATMSIETQFGDRESMEQMLEMGMEQGMTETLNKVDPLLGTAKA